MKNPVTKIKKTAAGEAMLFFGLVGAWHREKKGEKKHIAKRFNDERICLSWV